MKRPFRICFKILLFPLMGLLFSCRSTYKTGYEMNVSKNSIDMSSHEIVYKYDQKGIFPYPANANLDAFDHDFLEKLKQEIGSGGYALNTKGSLQTLKLSDCVIDFKRGKPEMKIYRNDTLFIREVQATLACMLESDSIRFFYSQIDYPTPFEAIPLNLFPKKDSMLLEDFRFSNNFAYKELPLGIDKSVEIANKLAIKTYNKLDTLSKVYFAQTYPDKYYQIHKTSGLVHFAEGLAVVSILAGYLYLKLIGAI